MESIWSRVKWDSQYQQDELQDWLVIEFDTDGAPEEFDLIQLFWEVLKPSVKSQIDQRGRELDSWEMLVKKAIAVKAKTGP